MILTNPKNMPKKTEIENIEIRSEEVQEILGYIPHWIIRRGISSIFFVIIIILVGSYYFKYPDIVQASIIITTQNPPVSLVAKRSGKINKIYVKDKQKILKGDYLATIQNTALFEHLILLKQELNKISQIISSKSFVLNFEELNDIILNFGEEEKNSNNNSSTTFLAIGEMQLDYNNFINIYYEYEFLATKSSFKKKYESLQIKLKDKKSYFLSVKNQVELAIDFYNLTYRQYQRDSTSFSKGFTTKDRFEEAQKLVIENKSTLFAIKSRLANIKVSIAELNENILTHNILHEKEQNRKKTEILNSIHNIKLKIKLWEENYLFVSPTNGKVSFVNIWSVNQNIKKGDILFNIIPEFEGDKIGRIKIPIMGAGKVKKNQEVNIKLNDYPFYKYGIIRGIIEDISLLPNNNHYYANISFPNGFKTSYNIELKINQLMQGKAEIITEDIRLLERILEPIIKVFVE